MTTYFFTVRDYRMDMRNMHSSARSHAVCRRLTATNQNSPVYGAHYWAACKIIGEDAPQYDDGLAAYLAEMHWGGFQKDKFGAEWAGRTEVFWRNVFAWAWNRVMRMKEEAERLATSVLW